jgi:hypothetical protein
MEFKLRLSSDRYDRDNQKGLTQPSHWQALVEAPDDDLKMWKEWLVGDN